MESERSEQDGTSKACRTLVSIFTNQRRSNWIQKIFSQQEIFSCQKMKSIFNKSSRSFKSFSQKHLNLIFFITKRELQAFQDGRSINASKVNRLANKQDSNSFPYNVQSRCLNVLSEDWWYFRQFKLKAFKLVWHVGKIKTVLQLKSSLMYWQKRADKQLFTHSLTVQIVIIFTLWCQTQSVFVFDVTRASTRLCFGGSFGF